MLFYEPLFLYLFFPALFLVYCFAGRGRTARIWILALASILFYAWTEPRFILVVFASVFADLLVAECIQRLRPGSAARRYWLVAGVTANVAVLVYYKYAGFLVANMDSVLRAFGARELPVLQIALPVGVSFIVFEKITYLVDVYRGIAKPARSVISYVLYVFFFPKLLAGPIIKYHDLSGQIDVGARADASDFVEGLSRFMLGVVKKLLIADVLAAGADLIFSRNAEGLGSGGAWCGALFFTLQIYFDFSAYSDMAIGLARIFGFRLLENFNMPYVADSISDFWRRWHMSLTGWIRDYLYIPLGGNRVSEGRMMFNLWVCFLASGIWHGAAWTFVIWGIYNGVFLVLDKLFFVRWLERLPRWIANLVTMLIVTIGFTIFRASSLEQAGALLSLMVRPWASATVPMDIPVIHIIVAALAVTICVAQRATLALPGFSWPDLAKRYALTTNLALSALFLVALAKGLAEPFRPFIYFRF